MKTGHGPMSSQQVTVRISLIAYRMRILFRELKNKDSESDRNITMRRLVLMGILGQLIVTMRILLIAGRMGISLK
jgi:hypothetical protein